MKLKAAVFVFAALSLMAAAVYAYEFHLLNGMVFNGDLKDFKEDQFFVKTDFGSVTIDAVKLDYIIVDESDGEKRPQPAGPGLMVENAGQGSPDAPEFIIEPTPAPITVPAPPEPFESVSAPPEGLHGWTLGRNP